MSNFDYRILTDDEGTTEEEIALQGLAALEAAIAMNIMYFERHPDAVCALVCGQIKYDSKNKNVLGLVASISTAPRLIKVGKGLCIDIVAFDVAVRRFEGKQAWPKIIPKGDGAFFHVVTEVPGPGGQDIEIDPSTELEHMGFAVQLQPDHCGACEVQNGR
jgi:hypothetical protein